MKPDDPDSGKQAQEYWAGRLKPLMEEVYPRRDVLFLCADKVGKEKCYALEKDKEVEIQFIGSSCAVSINRQKLKKGLGKTEEAAFTVTYEFP
jgi:hypothetical protein